MSEQTEVQIEGMPDGSPPILIQVPWDLEEVEAVRLRRYVITALHERKPLVIRGDCTVYQLIDGQWRKLGEESPARESYASQSFSPEK